MVPGWYQGASSEVPGEDRSGPLLLPFQMLILLWWVFGAANVRASADIEGRTQNGDCRMGGRGHPEPLTSHLQAICKPTASHSHASPIRPSSHLRAKAEARGQNAENQHRAAQNHPDHRRAQVTGFSHLRVVLPNSLTNRPPNTHSPAVLTAQYPSMGLPGYITDYLSSATH